MAIVHLVATRACSPWQHGVPDVTTRRLQRRRALSDIPMSGPCPDRGVCPNDVGGNEDRGTGLGNRWFGALAAVRLARTLLEAAAGRERGHRGGRVRDPGVVGGGGGSGGRPDRAAAGGAPHGRGVGRRPDRSGERDDVGDRSDLAPAPPDRGAAAALARVPRRRTVAIRSGIENGLGQGARARRSSARRPTRISRPASMRPPSSWG